MPNPNHRVLRHEIFAQHSRMSPSQGLLRTFGDICDALDVIQVSANDVLDPARRLVRYMVGLKIVLFHLRYQGDCIHNRGLDLFFHMRYSRLLYGKK